jgi:hypothetical protein
VSLATAIVAQRVSPFNRISGIFAVAAGWSIDD